jgi:hypothetical protein
MTDARKHLKTILRTARRQGYEVSQTKHWKIRSPSGDVVCCSASPSCPHALRKIIKDLRGIGVVL